MSSLTLFVGIDVAKETLDVAVRPTAETWQVANEMAEINTLVAQLEVMAPALVVLEATGGFEGPCSRRWLWPRSPWCVPTHARSGQQHIVWLEGLLTSVDTDLTHAIQQSAVGQATEAVLQSIPVWGRSSRGPCWVRYPR